MRIREGFMDKEEFHAWLKFAGASISETQIDDWCEKGLMSRTPRGLGLGQGSVGLYPEIAVRQALEIDRLLKIKKRANYVGWQLWWQGFEVKERHWRPEFETQHAMVGRALPRLAKFMRAFRDDEFEAGDISKHIDISALPPPTRRRALNIGPERFNTAILALLNAITGIETEFYDDPVSGDDVDYDRKDTSALLGFAQSEKDQVAGTKLNAGRALDDVLRALSTLPSAFAQNGQYFSGASLAALYAARDDVRNIFETVAMMHQSFEWIYGKQAFGLRAAVWFAQNATPSSLAPITIAWKHIREHDHAEAFRSPREIAEMRKSAAETLARSNQLQNVIKSDPKMVAILTKKRRKEAVSEPEKMQKLCREIARIRKG